MGNVQIITDHKWRHFLFGYELPERAKRYFDWISPEEFDSAPFIKYRRRFYALDDFLRLEGYVPGGFDAYHSDSYFSCVVIKISDDGESYKIGLMLS